MAQHSTNTSPYNTTDEVTWFISVTKRDSDSWETFVHEYTGVHAGMVQQQRKFVGTPQAYTQVALTDTIRSEERHPGWNFLTCLTWESVAQIYDGLQSPGYKESAGKHVFCRLDQQGGIFSKVATLPSDSQYASACQMIVFHRRVNQADEASETWFQDRLQWAKKLSSESSSLKNYTSLRDVMPKNEAQFFADTQFSGGSWLLFKAVERFDFGSVEDGLAFVRRYRTAVTDGRVSDAAPVIVIGTPTTVV